MDQTILDGLSDADRAAAINEYQAFGTAVVLILDNGDKRYVPINELWPVMRNGDTTSITFDQTLD